MIPQTIQSLMIAPNAHPQPVILSNDLDSLQKAVSIGVPEQGLIEFVYLEDNVSILCNEEGKLIGLEPNRRLGKDILCGVFYIVAEDKEGNLVSLTPAQMDKYSAVFGHPDVIEESEVADTVIMKFFPL